MGPRREMAVRNPSECHSVLPPSLPLSPPRWISAHCKPPINLLASSRRRKLHSSPPPPSIFTLSPFLFFFLSILYFWAVWVNSTKGNFLFTLHRAFSLTRWHCDNALWELRVSLMRCKCKYTTEHASTPHLKTCTVTCYRKGLCGMMTSATKCDMKVWLLWADKQWGDNFA